MRDDSSEGTDTDVEVVEEGVEGETMGPVPAAFRDKPDLSPVTYRLGRSRVTEAELDKYVEQGILKSSLCGLCRAPGGEGVPHLEPYEAVVFRDFFEARLRFPCEDFMGKVLQRFNLQIHHLTPNAFARLSVFAMALKMARCIRYETHLHKKVVKDK